MPKIEYSKNFSTIDFPIGIPHPKFLSSLQAARDEYGHPMTITSGGRTPETNESVGGVFGSSHLIGFEDRFRASDIACEDSATRFYMLKALLKHFRRIGIYEKHLHIDDDPTKPPNVIWIG